MRCDEFARYLTDRDNNEPLPFAMEIHARQCEVCHRMIAVNDIVLASFRDAVAEDADEAFTARVMAAIAREVQACDTQEQTMPLRNWLVVGGLMVLGFLVLPFSEVMASYRTTVGPAVDVATALILGMVVTLYACVLVVANHRRLARWFRHRPREL